MAAANILSFIYYRVENRRPTTPTGIYYAISQHNILGTTCVLLVFLFYFVYIPYLLYLC